jgi:hypothetical protein
MAGPNLWKTARWTMAAIAGMSCAQAPPAPLTLAPRVTLDVKLHAHSVIADDVNGDGKIDLIVAAAGADSVAIFAGHGDGSFDAPTYWPVGAAPKFAVTADFNKDGKRDIVTADQNSKTISVLLGNGDGTFKPKTSYPACNGDHEVVVADFNRDGNEDVAVACHGKPYFASVFFGSGDGTFKPRLDLHPGGEPAALVVGDYNRDGVPDLAYANRADSTVGVMLSNGDGTFKEPMAFATAKAPHAIRSGDLNDDGVLDLVTADDRANMVTVLFGTGDGHFGKRADLPANSLPKSVAVADINGDGHPDIVITNTTYPSCCTYAGSTISVFLNRGDGSFGSRQDFEAGGDPFSLLVKDLNGDGKADIATANFIDQVPLQHWYLQTLKQSGMQPRTFTMLFLGFAILGGLVVVALGWRRARMASIVFGTLVTAIIVGVFWEANRPRTDGPSHISILFGR